MKNSRKILIIAFAALGKGLSGSDRIFIEFAKRWSQKINVEIYVWEDGEQMIRRQKLKNNFKLKVETILMDKWSKLGFVGAYLFRVLHSIQWSLFKDLSEVKYIYSASEFWMDTFPAVILKLRNTQIKWIASWYQTAPSPVLGYSTGERKEKYRFKSFIYWLVQIPAKLLIMNFADLVLVNNQSEKEIFNNLNKKNRVKVVYGAVDSRKIKYFKSKYPFFHKSYDAVFQGRFHPQKGVKELITIWSKVVKKIPRAKLIMIGDGPLTANVQALIKKLKLSKNITLKGYLFDGDEKYSIFARAKLVVHPAFFDSGGMSSAEAMAFDIPAIGFQLVSYQDYFPIGMSQVQIGNLDLFAEEIVSLLKNPRKREKIGLEAGNYILQNWSWNKRAIQTWGYISKL